MARFEECPANDDYLCRHNEPCPNYTEFRCDGCNMLLAYQIGKRDGIKECMEKFNARFKKGDKSDV